MDPIWYCAMMRGERMRRRQEEYRKQQQEQFSYKNLAEIEELLS